MEFKKAHSGQYLNDEHYQFGGEFDEQIIAFGPAELKIEPLYDVWKYEFDREDTALKKISKSGFTEKLVEASKKCDRTFRGIVDLNRSMLHHFNPGMVEAAKTLQLVFDAYGNIAGYAKNAKTGAYNNFIKEMHFEHNAEAVLVVGMDKWLDELECNNDEVFGLLQQRTDEQASRTDIGVADARKKVDAAYKAILKRISALYEVEGSEMYDIFIRRMNVIIDRYNRGVELRRGRGTKGDVVIE